MNLLRRLNGGAGYMGEFDALPRDTGYGSYSGFRRQKTSRPRSREFRSASLTSSRHRTAFRD
jgi:hypothetical protein